MRRVEYKALRKIPRPYHGSSHEKLGYITAVEPLQSRLDNISILCAARSLRTEDKEILELLEQMVVPGHTS